MPYVDLATAKQDIRVIHDEDDELIARLTGTAEAFAQRFIGRNVYATQAELDAARAGAAAAFEAATLAYEQALAAAESVTNAELAALMLREAGISYANAAMEFDRVAGGMLANDTLITGTTLILADLYEHRGDEEAIIGIPTAAQSLLWTLRRDLPL